MKVAGETEIPSVSQFKRLEWQPVLSARIERKDLFATLANPLTQWPLQFRQFGDAAKAESGLHLIERVCDAICGGVGVLRMKPSSVIARRITMNLIGLVAAACWLQPEYVVARGLVSFPLILVSEFCRVRPDAEYVRECDFAIHKCGLPPTQDLALFFGAERFFALNSAKRQIPSVNFSSQIGNGWTAVIEVSEIHRGNYQPSPTSDIVGFCESSISKLNAGLYRIRCATVEVVNFDSEYGHMRAVQFEPFRSARPNGDDQVFRRIDGFPRDPQRTFRIVALFFGICRQEIGSRLQANRRRRKPVGRRINTDGGDGQDASGDEEGNGREGQNGVKKQMRVSSDLAQQAFRLNLIFMVAAAFGLGLHFVGWYLAIFGHRLYGSIAIIVGMYVAISGPLGLSFRRLPFGGFWRRISRLCAHSNAH